MKYKRATQRSITWLTGPDNLYLFGQFTFFIAVRKIHHQPNAA